MNLPNKLTILRLILAPLFFVVYFLPEWTTNGAGASSVIIWSAWVLIAIYITIELSDLLDGIIARRFNMITNLGKVLDPFADVISRITYFFCLSYSGIMPLWIFLIILYRELSIIFLRMIMMGRGVAMAANIWGKSKAVLYAISGLGGIGCTFIFRLFPEVTWMDTYEDMMFVVFVLAAAASIISFLTYVKAIAKSGALKDFDR